MTRQRVTDRGNPRKYWTQVPNLVDESDLDPYARTLYLHYLRIAGQRESCVETVRESAAGCCMSPATVLKARQRLVDESWIEVEDMGTHGRGADQRIHLLDRWAENIAHFDRPATEPSGNVRVANNSPAEPSNCPGGERNDRGANNSFGNVQLANVPLHQPDNSNSTSFFKPEERDVKNREEAREPAREILVNSDEKNDEATDERVPCQTCGRPAFSRPPWSGLCGACRRKGGLIAAQPVATAVLPAPEELAAEHEQLLERSRASPEPAGVGAEASP